MWRIFRSPPVLTEETHRATSFEVFFDLVFIFALTRIIAFMGHPPTPLRMAQGLILLLLLWMAWTTYTWLGNQARADVGLVPAGTVAAMAALFVTALVIPDAFQHTHGDIDPPLTLSVAYVVLRVLDIALYFHIAAGDRQMRVTLRIFSVTAALACALLLAGAVGDGPVTQTALWAAAFVIDFGGGFLASTFSGWRLRSPSHFTERHGLVLIISLGESLISAGSGAGAAVTHGYVLLAALLGFVTAVCLWWLYFKNSAAPAGEALGRVSTDQRGREASNAYSLAHFLLIAGVIYTALGIEQALADLAHDIPRDNRQPWLGWTSVVALYGGVTLYLAGRALFLHFTVRSVPRTQLVAIAVSLVLLPVGHSVPALAAIGLQTAFLVALVGYEWQRRERPEPRHGNDAPLMTS
ncbi:low temperature requirement protein A [Rugosimonospora africana]|uniref:Low temperature requirement protein A n=1 Tax=Rugosimonospora africana TaxID=556532 RepID=A0A8J3VRB1_9ACTN|nr:low temperature requirement protein A [Rugosimonospora africana]GIH15912.1 low temperature requirement protein A [Rugosimonospora africana]